ncbi:hypothetical protein P8452_62506 [Trifolium repens]|nr:hypothetical protein P8452_62506 [Trifolium repens]
MCIADFALCSSWKPKTCDLEIFLQLGWKQRTRVFFSKHDRWKEEIRLDMSTSSRKRHYRQPPQPQPQPPPQLPPQHQQPQPPTQPPLPIQPQPPQPPLQNQQPQPPTQPQPPQPPPLPQPPQPHHSHWIVDVIDADVPTTKKDLVYETNIKAKFVVNDQDHRKLDPDTMRKANQNAKNRQKQCIPHTLGRKSSARTRDEMEN